MRAVVYALRDDDGQPDLESPYLWDCQVAADIAFSHECAENPNLLRVELGPVDLMKLGAMNWSGYIPIAVVEVEDGRIEREDREWLLRWGERPIEAVTAYGALESEKEEHRRNVKVLWDGR